MIIVAALVALLQVTSARTGGTSPLTAAGTSLAVVFETVAGTATVAARNGAVSLTELPSLLRENRELRAQNVRLTTENARLEELVAQSDQASALAPTVAVYPRSVEARIIGFPPENETRTVTIDRGTVARVARDDGVIDADGVVGRVVEASPFASKVLLITDYSSSVPAMVQRGRWWGIARGNLTSVRVEYISQDAPIRPGDAVVTGEARSFHSGALIGTIVRVERSPTGLYQTAIVRPAADLASIDRVVVVPK
ncbi:MAG: rod shape-determining protein MreC [Candidatus Eremiobacteraeota bacterium]|nr:rod shape-determining protein MreC [Candidatus Eremiobacteraeota bacterium]